MNVYIITVYVIGFLFTWGTTFGCHQIMTHLFCCVTTSNQHGNWLLGNLLLAQYKRAVFEGSWQLGPADRREHISAFELLIFSNF